jgi:hypothetical protein|tara:strand:- start:1776 stop:1982 length:207 start_codon:yes stop_codon:yes gene_type:complete
MKYKLSTPLSAHVVADIQLSFGAKGMYCFMCEFADPDGCYSPNFPPEDNKILLELSEAGYIQEYKGQL